MGEIVRISPAKLIGQPFFDPWIGDDYRLAREAALAGESSCCGGLWHIMGESHYGKPEEYSPGFTRVMIEEACSPRASRFFDTILSIATGKPFADIERRADWSRFAFSNFVQDMLPKTRKRPNEAEWRRGRDAFFGQLVLTRPKQLLIVGKTQWEWTPKAGYIPIAPFQPAINSGGGTEAGVYAYEVEGEIAFTLVTWVYHPSSWGELDVEVAQQRVRELTNIGCNVLSELQCDKNGWFYEQR